MRKQDKMNLTRHRILALLAAVVLSVASALAGVWEPVDPARVPPQVGRVDPVASEAGVTMVEDAQGIYLVVQRPVTVKVFSILGQLVSQETLRPGAHRLHMRTRGIYIVRAGQWARRIRV